MSDYVRPGLLPGMAEYSGLIRILWDRDNVVFGEHYPYHLVSTRIRQALTDLGIKNPRIFIECYAAYPEKFDDDVTEMSAYQEDPDIKLFYAAESKREAVFQGVDAQILDHLRVILNSRQNEAVENLEMVIVGVMTGDGDYRDLMIKLRKKGVIALSIKPKPKENEKGNKTNLLKANLNRAGAYNASMMDIDNPLGVLVKWWPGIAEDMVKMDPLEVLKIKYLNIEDKDDEEEEEDWGEFLVKRFGQTWVANLKAKGLSYEDLGPYLSDELISVD